MKPPDTLEYQTPTSANSALRQKVCGQTSGISGLLLVMSVAFGIATWRVYRRGGELPVLLTIGCVNGWYFMAGVFYIVAGIKVLTPNPFWERLLQWSAWTNSIVATVLTGVVLFNLVWGSGGSVTPPGFLLVLGFSAIHWISFGMLGARVARLRRLG